MLGRGFLYEYVEISNWQVKDIEIIRKYTTVVTKPV
jgi:hypothetical protein